MATKYINISEKYGENFEATISDYQSLNPSGKFVEKDGGIYEWEFFGEGALDYNEELVAVSE